MKKTLSSPLVAAANNIVSLGSRSNSLPKFQREYINFGKFLEVEKRSLEKLKLPDKKKIRALASLNIASNFGRPGNLLGSLFSGALDLAGFVGNMFPGRGKMGKPQKPSNIRPPKPTIRGPRLKLGGMRAVGVGNALFAGLDFATGLAEGESVGKAAAGAGGALAGGLLGGAIGQALIPIPGLGFVVGNMAGSFLGGFAADRVYEGGSALKQKLAERLKGQEAKQKALTSGSSFVDSISKFEQSVGKFEEFINKSFASMVNAAAAAAGSDEMMLDYGLDPDAIPDSPELPGELPDMTAEGGQLPSRYTSSGYGWRWGRLHSGVDYAITEGTPVSVIQPGQVTYAQFNDGGYGYAVQVAHPGGSSSFYGHLSKISVKEGQKIEPGTVIGNVGSTGRSTGPHVHFEVRQGSKRLEIPTGEGDKYFRFGGNVKVKPKSGASGKPTAVLMAGTNDYGDPKSGAAGITKAIKELQAKGYDVVVVPPSEQGAYANVSKEVQKSASAAGASIEKGQYNPNDPTRAYTHLLPDSAKAIQSKYKGATFVGDSNAEFVSGAKSYRGEGASAIADKIKSAIPMAPQAKPGIGGAEADPKMLEMYKQGLINQMSSYPSYNQPGGGTSVIMPIMMGGGGGGQQRPVFIPVGGGGGGGTVIMPGPTEGQVVNSLMKTMLLTNLSAT
jgi:murein DD-endopeptidase MepM/ murein hydrolase activator NlpD